MFGNMFELKFPCRKAQRLALAGRERPRASSIHSKFLGERSDVLLKFLYPELASVDVYKGLMLANAALDNNSALGETAHVQYGMFILLMNGGTG